MKNNPFAGKLIAFDGPNGAGKTTLLECVKNTLQEMGISAYTTKEPTSSVLGDFTRKIAEELSGESLACLVAADRYHHIFSEIVPQLMDGHIVLTDRYILSSLILQRMDNVDVEFILNINSKIFTPDIQIAVEADVGTIEDRLSQRNALTRLEQGKRTQEELYYMHEGVEIIKKLGVQTIVINNTKDLLSNASEIVRNIKENISL